MSEPAYVEGWTDGDLLLQIRRVRAETEVLTTFYSMLRLKPEDKGITKQISVEQSKMSLLEQPHRLRIGIGAIRDCVIQSMLKK